MLKKSWMKRFLGCLILLFPVLVFAEAETIHVTKEKSEFKIAEPANPTTGYVWSIEYDRNLLVLEKQSYIIKNPKLIGSGGETIWIFKAKPEAFLKQKDTQIKLKYSRPWESQEGATETFFLVEFD